MGGLFLFILITGTILYVKYTFFNLHLHWRIVLSVQASVLGAALLLLDLFLLTPIATRLIDLLFS